MSFCVVHGHDDPGCFTRELEDDVLVLFAQLEILELLKALGVDSDTRGL